MNDTHWEKSPAKSQLPGNMLNIRRIVTPINFNFARVMGDNTPFLHAFLSANLQRGAFRCSHIGPPCLKDFFDDNPLWHRSSRQAAHSQNDLLSLSCFGQ